MPEPIHILKCGIECSECGNTVEVKLKLEGDSMVLCWCSICHTRLFAHCKEARDGFFKVVLKGRRMHKE